MFTVQAVTTLPGSSESFYSLFIFYSKNTTLHTSGIRSHDSEGGDDTTQQRRLPVQDHAAIHCKTTQPSRARSRSHPGQDHAVIQDGWIVTWSSLSLKRSCEDVRAQEDGRQGDDEELEEDEDGEGEGQVGRATEIETFRDWNLFGTFSFYIFYSTRSIQ
jgi:hypothetical protein